MEDRIIPTISYDLNINNINDDILDNNQNNDLFLFFKTKQNKIMIIIFHQ